MHLALMCIIAVCSFELALSCSSKQNRKQNLPAIVCTSARAPLLIANGEDAEITEFPWQVSIMRWPGHICGGAIIRPRHILTAAHCVSKWTPADLYVVAGTNKLGLENQKLYRVARMMIHPEYNDTDTELDGEEKDDLGHDIAVISLLLEIEMNAYQQMIPLPSQDLPESVDADFSGFGMVCAKPSEACPMILQKIKIHISDPSACVEHYGHIHSYEICGSTPTGSGPCHGDSGGALVYNGELVGIATLAHCGAPNGEPTVFERVQYYENFILDAIDNS